MRSRVDHRVTRALGVDVAIGRGRSRGSRSRAPRRSKKHARCARWLIPKADELSLRGDAPGWRSPRHPAGGPVIREAAVGRDESGESRVPRSIEGRARGGRRKVFDFPGGREDSPQRHSVSAAEATETARYRVTRRTRTSDMSAFLMTALRSDIWNDLREWTGCF
jgi:hypothetical protein